MTMTALDPLAVEIGAYARDPLGFVLFAWPWGEPGTALAGEDGPEDWQRELLGLIGRRLAGKAPADGAAAAHEAIRIAVASGHGVGKSALVAWIVIWALATCRDARGIVTANTERQLVTKTWPELVKWLRLSAVAPWFACGADAIASTEPGRARTWRVDAVPWTVGNAEAFAGLHNQGRRVLAVFDEASAIPDLIWETTEGALTDKGTELLWLAFGNPTRNTGRFRECFGRFRHRWTTRRVDSRDVTLTDRREIANWQADYGEDSDFFRIRVRGEFPRAGALQFIDGERIARAMAREARCHLGEPLVIGVDVARFGDDRSVIAFRRGLDARTLPPVKLRGVDLMTLAGRVAHLAIERRAQAVFVDEGGLGAGVVDRLRQLLRGQLVAGVNFAGRADRTLMGEGFPAVANKRAEMWAALRDWLQAGALPDDPEIAADLGGVEYGYNARNEIQLERKQDMKRRGLASPDIADALALTFAYPVADLAREELAPREPHMMKDDWEPYRD